MARRKVTRTAKDSDGDITALCDPDSTWKRRSKADAINDIETGTHSYYVQAGSSEVGIQVVNGENGKYLRTNPGGGSGNNLDNLPDC